MSIKPLHAGGLSKALLNGWNPMREREGEGEGVEGGGGEGGEHLLLRKANSLPEMVVRKAAASHQRRQPLCASTST